MGAVHSNTHHEKRKQELRAEIGQFLERCFLRKPDAEPVRVARHIVKAGGHRWRGLLGIGVGQIFTPENVVELCLPGAASVELAHAASMLLDDLPSMDNASVRRGLPCAHLVFPRWAVDLAPAFMVSMAYEVALSETPASPERRIQSAIASAEAAELMMLGQQDDLCLLSQPCDEKSVMDCYYRKSGSLYGCAAKTGAIVSGGSEEDIERCYRMGMDLGVSYQIMDDVADIEAGAEEMGKNPGMDSGKHTAPILLGVEVAKSRARELQERAMGKLACYGEEADFLRYLVGHLTWANV